MEYISPHLDVNLDPQGFVIDLDSLYATFARLPDRRKPQGLRYSLATVLVFLVLGKLAGEDRIYGLSQWVKHRIHQLCEALHLKAPRAPSPNTYSRIVGKVIAEAELQQAIQEFFAAQRGAGLSVQLCLDGKTMRGTIRTGQTQGVHLLAAYLPAEGWVLLQVEVGRKENEIVAAPKLLKTLDLRGKVVTGDALLAQRELSAQIVEAGGEYVWTVKENQPELHQDIERLFAPEPVVKGFSPASHEDFETANTVEKSHGRMAWRELTASQALKGYVDWPYAEQVFQLERTFKRVADGKITHEIVYGITSLTRQEAGPERLLEITRSHWAIENSLHYRRDETLREDWCHLRVGHADRAMALLNNLILGLLARLGYRNVPEARRYYAAHLEQAVRLVLFRPARL